MPCNRYQQSPKTTLGYQASDASPVIYGYVGRRAHIATITGLVPSGLGTGVPPSPLIAFTY